MGEPERLLKLLPSVLFCEFARFRPARSDSVTYGCGRLVSEFWRESWWGKSSPKTFCSRFLWYPARVPLDLEPVLLTVVALAMDGRLSSLGKPMLSSWLPRRVSLGDSWAMSSLESLKKLPQTLAAMDEPLAPAEAHGGVGEVAVGGLREMEGMRLPDVSSTASCFRWSRKSR